MRSVRTGTSLSLALPTDPLPRGGSMPQDIRAKLRAMTQTHAAVNEGTAA